MKPAHPIRILLVEDSPDDIALTREALADCRLLNDMYVARDGVEALDFLHRRGPFTDAPRPDLILLDLNLPRKDGREVLEELKEHPDLRVIPVVVLTTSRAEADVLKAYRLHANCYIPKPVDFDRFLEVVRSVEHFWVQVVSLPPEP